MRTCEKCKKVFDDDMNYCPYCGEKYHDYHEDLKNVMDELFDEEQNPSEDKKKEKEKTQPIYVEKVKEEKPPVSRVEKQKKLKEEKENNILNKILLVLIVLLVVVFLGGGYFIAKTYLFPTNEPVVNEDVPSENEDNQPEEDESTPSQSNEDENDTQQNENESNETTSDTPVNVINENMEGENVTITAIQASDENGQTRLDITCESKTTGEIYLTDGGSLNIGPIQLREGSNSFYFTLGINENSQYTLSFQYEGGQDQMTITYDMIMNAIAE